LKVSLFLVGDLDAGLGLGSAGLVLGDARVVALVALLQAFDLQPTGGHVLGGAATHGGHDVAVVTGAVGGLGVGAGDLPADGGGGEADGLARQEHVGVGGVLHVLGSGHDAGLGLAGADVLDLKLQVAVTHR